VCQPHGHIVTGYENNDWRPTKLLKRKRKLGNSNHSKESSLPPPFGALSLFAWPLVLVQRCRASQFLVWPWVPWSLPILTREK